MKRIIYFVLIYTLFGCTLHAELSTIKPFTTDGCSLFPDGNLNYQRLWQKCCVEHDKAYWQGGTYEERKAADLSLENCVAEVGQPELASLMLAGVRVGGSPYWPTPFRWGYGWAYLRGYQPLTPEENLSVEAAMEAYLRKPQPLSKHWNTENVDETYLFDVALDNLMQNYSQYQVKLVSLDKGEELCEILDVYRGKQDVVVKFKYRGISRLILDDFDEKQGIALGTYTLSIPMAMGTTQVRVDLKFNKDGTAEGFWSNLGFEKQFDLVKKKQ